MLSIFKYISVHLLGFVFVCLLLVSVAEADVENPLQLTEEEQAWLGQHSVVRVGFDPHFEPYEFVNEQGQLLGISQEYLQLLSEKLGVEFKPVLHQTWSEVVAAIKSKNIDVLSSVTQTPQRLSYLNFTKNYVQYKAAIVTQWDSYQISRLEDLAGKPVAFVKDYALSELILAKEPSIQPVYVETILDGLKAISNHQAVAIVSDLGSVTYKIRQYKMSHLEVAGLVDVGAEGLSMAVRKDWPMLQRILDKALGSFSNKERDEILRRWIPVEDKTPIQLSHQEKQFLEEHPIIKLGVDPEFAPFEFLDEQGNYRGIASEYLQLLSRMLGVRFKIEKGIGWDEAVELAKHKALDVLPAVGVTEERKIFFNFSKPYLQFQRVLINRVGSPFLRGLEDTVHLRVAVQKNSSHEGFLQAYGNITPLTFETLQEMLLAVSDGRADVVVGNVASCSFWIRKMNLTNLKVAAATGDVQGIHFAIRKDWPELVSAINKGLDSVSLLEKHRISERWVTINYDPLTDYALIKKIIISFLVALFFLSLWLLYVYQQRRLLKQARDEALKANEGLKKLQNSLEQKVSQKTEALMVSERKFRQAQKMEALGVLASGIAHDFNNVLTSMITTVQLVQMKDKKHDEMLGSVCEQGFRAADMIKQLMSFARQESSEKALVSLDTFLLDVERLVRITVGKNIEILFEICEETLPAMVNTTQMQQVIFNLCNNAAFALVSVPNAKLVVQLFRCEGDEGSLASSHIEGDAFACIKVQDNGVGIPSKLIDNIFDPFFTTKQEGDGTGLGLAMVYGTVQEHGGLVEVESKLAQGTSFTIFLPLAQKVL